MQQEGVSVMSEKAPFELFHFSLDRILLTEIFTARKRSLRRLCFYTCLSVILFRGSTWAGTPPGPGTHPPPEPGTHLPGPGKSPEQCMPGKTGNKPTVRILLECILVCHQIQ